jgi:predicted acyl esterase
MTRTRRLRVFVTVAAVGLSIAGVPRAGAAPDSYTVQSLHFRVAVGPNDSTICDLDADVYVPAKATGSRRVPAVLMTNGWLGEKGGQSGVAQAFARRDYVTVTYSGLGWGGSSCKIMLDDPQWDGKAASQIVSYLGGAPGIAFADAAHTKPAKRMDAVILDRTNNAGGVSQYDPRVGMVGGSYGGGIQFAAASADARIDTIVPANTWNDMSYAIAPNGATATKGVSSATPGAFKVVYGAGLLGTGAPSAVTGQTQPQRLVGCPNLVDRFCPDMSAAAAAGFLSPDAVAFYRSISPATFMPKIKIPVLLIQGEWDTLFNLNEAVANYRALKAQGTPVKMIWHSGGHSGPDAPGESSSTPDFSREYQSQRIFQRYLHGVPVDTGPQFSYFRPWIKYGGSAAAAYASSTSFPVGHAKAFYLSGSGTLSNSPRAVQSGAQTLVTPPAGVVTSANPVDLVAPLEPAAPKPEADAPGTAASWTTPVLTSPIDVAGSPRLTLKVDAPLAASTQSDDPATQLVLFVKLLDVGPDGSASLIRYQNLPVRIPDVTKPVQITLGGLVHRFAPGHQLRLTVAGGSANYRGNSVSNAVTISSGVGQVLTLPVL